MARVLDKPLFLTLRQPQPGLSGSWPRASAQDQLVLQEEGAIWLDLSLPIVHLADTETLSQKRKCFVLRPFPSLPSPPLPLLSSPFFPYLSCLV